MEDAQILVNQLVQQSVSSLKEKQLQKMIFTYQIQNWHISKNTNFKINDIMEKNAKKNIDDKIYDNEEEIQNDKNMSQQNGNQISPKDIADVNKGVLKIQLENLEKIIGDLFNPVINNVDTVSDNTHDIIAIQKLIDNLHLVKIKQLLTLNYVLLTFEKDLNDH